MTEKILEIINIKKSFGSIHAVRGVSFSVEAGECYGLLGPNGAGKSTTIEMIEHIREPDSGKILFRGKDLDRLYFDQLGVQFQETALPQKQTVYETIDTFSRLYPHPVPIDQLIETCQLSGFIDQYHERISGGQRQRLHLALALCNNPALILLDEPTTGLDPQARRHLWSIVKGIKEQGCTIILTTHYMDEASELCDRIGIMDKGVVMIEGRPDSLLEENFETVVVEVPINVVDQLSATAADEIIRRPNTAEIHTKALNETLQALAATGCDLKAMRIRQSNLEDLFLKLTGRELRS